MKHIVRNEADWHALRKTVVTASEAATLVGADPYSSPARLRNPEPFSGNAYTLVGQMLEPVVVNITNQVLGRKFQLFEQEADVKEFYTCGNLGATPDAHENRATLLECKTTRPKTYLKYSSVPPNKYIIQLLVQMICTDIDYGYLAILSTDLTQQTATLRWPITIYYVWKNPIICDILKSEAERFKNNATYRVNSKVKQRVKLLLPTIWSKIV